MWIFLNNAMLSIVQKPGDNDHLTVRARLKGDIERVFPDAKVQADGGTDYKYRASVPRQEVADALHAQVMGIDYGNFKGSVHQHERHDVYMGVWRVMWNAQEKFNPLRAMRAKRGQRAMFDGAL